MTTFDYSAIDGAGMARRGRVEAASRQAAIATLAAQRLFVTTIDEGVAGEKSSGPASTQALVRAWGGVAGGGTGRVGAKQVAALWRQLSTALEAGLPLLTALRVVREQAANKAVAGLLDDLAKRVETGSALSDALAEHPKTFTPLHVSMVRAGETAGVLDEVMASLADFADRDLATREKVRSASVYPLIVLSLAVVSVLVILTFIMPKILETVGDNPAVLPWPTRMLLGLSVLLRSYGWIVVLLLIGAVVWFRRWVSTPDGRAKFDGMQLRLPLVGNTLRDVAVARFARALGTLTKAGIHVVEALSVLRDALGNEALGRTVDDLKLRVTQGEPLADCLRDSGRFPPLFVQVVSLGEKTGKLDELLLRAADSLDKDAQSAISRVMTVLPAAMIVGLALLVALILASVLLPIVNMSSAIG